MAAISQLADISQLNIRTAHDAKRVLNKKEEGEYYYIKYLPLQLDAIKNAKVVDSDQVQKCVFRRIKTKASCSLSGRNLGSSSKP